MVGKGLICLHELDRGFEYDSIYRLTYANGRESNTQSGNNYLYVDAPVGNYDPSAVRYYERSYSYDKLGNVNSLVQAGTNGFTRNYSYNTGYNTLQRINDGSGVLIESYSYDACGNTISSNLNRRYAWNHADQLLCYKNQVGSSDPTVFTQYDYAGQDRVSKLVRTGTAGAPIFERTIYIDGVFEYVKLQSAAVYEKNYIHIMDDTSRIAELRINVGLPFPGDIADDLVYVLEDQIGSSVTRLDVNGTVIDQEEYYPFGDSSLRTFTYKRYRYVGKERDGESGLYYYGARYYAAWTCRFISVDPLAKKYAQLTPYNYADNNPINDFDIDGMQDSNTQGTPQGGGLSSAGTNAGSTPTQNNHLNNAPTAGPNSTSNRLQIATTANGPASGQQISAQSEGEKAAPLGNYYENTEQTSYNKDLSSACVLNTQNVSRTIKLSEPTDAEYMQMAQERANSGGASFGYGPVGINTQGDISAGMQKYSGGIDKQSSNITFNPADPGIKAIGAGGVMISQNGLSIDPAMLTDQIKNRSLLLSQLSINVVRESTTEYLPQYITHNAAGEATGIVQVRFEIKNSAASVIIGGFASRVTVIRSYTPNGEQTRERIIGTVTNKGISGAIKLPNGFNLGIDIQLQ